MRWLAVVAVVGAVPGCRQVFGIDPTQGAGDAGPDDAGADAPQNLMWSVPTRIDLGAPGAYDDDPAMTDDGLELYFNSNRSGNNAIWMASRATVDGPWGPPTLVTAVSGPDYETTPEISPDGLTLFFASDRPGGSGDLDVWVTQRAARSSLWLAPVHVPELATARTDLCGCLNTAVTAMSLSRISAAGDYDAFIATRANMGDAFQVVPAPGINTTGHEGGSCLSADGHTFYVDVGLNPDRDIAVAFRSTILDAFGAPAIIAELNSNAVDDDIWVSVDGRRALFHSTRDGQNGIWESSR